MASFTCEAITCPVLLIELRTTKLVACPAVSVYPAVHQIEQIAAALAAVRVALPLFGRVVTVDGDLAFSGVIAFTPKRTVDSLVGSGPRDLERSHAARLGRTGERLLRHPLIDVDPVFRSRHGMELKKGCMLL